MSNEETTPWIQRLLQRHVTVGSDDDDDDDDDEEHDHDHDVPALPTLPPEPVVPEGCDTTSACAHSAFFQRLPPDVRRMVLVEAFGDRTVHVDLRRRRRRRRRPPPPPPPGPGWLGAGDLLAGLGRAMLGGVQTYLGQEQQQQQHAPVDEREWRWHGSVCHRDPAWRVRGRRIGGGASVSEPAMDRCVVGPDGGARHDGARPPGCRVGAAGWLRTCRRAHVEGVEVLYGANRFHLSGDGLLRNLGRVLRPEHLALVGSAEMVWRLGRVARPPDLDVDLSLDRRFSGWYAFTSLLEAVPEALPNLRYLHVVLSGTWYPDQMAPNDIMRRSASDVLQPVDDMVRKFFLRNRSLVEVNVGLPRRIWLIREKHDKQATQRYEESRVFDDVSDRIWRSLGVLPEDSGREAVEMGYWTRMDIC